MYSYIFQDPSICNDTLKIFNHLFDTDLARVIDHTLNGVNDSLVVETDVTQLILSFETCVNMNVVSFGSGFKAFVSYESKKLSKHLNFVEVLNENSLELE
jgi:hypothetical protein